MKEEIKDKKAAILKATLELISEQGFHATPMSQIARKANVSIGTIYHYFTGKDDLINALYIDIKTRLAQYALQNYSSDVPVREGFKQLFSGVILYFIENPAELSFTEQYENSPLITSATHEEGMRIARPIKDFFERAMEQNLLKELPVEMLGALISGAVISLTKFYLLGTIKPDEASLNAGLDAIWDMIKR